ncbi:MAG: NADH-quinone oxidoreductase subunit N [Coriobacteriia bacterium]|nr:NADH-quinone oxidoreductase subunit N [Coriobacteriia bacterium]
MTGYALLVPELLVLIAIAWGLFSSHLPGRDRGAAYVGVVLVLVAAVAAALATAGQTLFGGALVFDETARFARVGTLVLAAVWLLWTAGRGEGRTREATALALFATMGALLMSCAADLVTIVLALELATMPAYVLVGYRRNRFTGLEGALKYFLLSLLTSLVMMYGLSFLYGVTGTTRLSEFDLSTAGTLGLLAMLLTFVGVFAKLSAAPFHYWAPDAYEGAEAWSVAFVSTVPKVAGAVVFVRLVAAIVPTAPIGATMVLIAAVASMVLGNLAALTQSDIRRMMAYSGVAHTGYLMLGAAGITAAGYGAAVFYALAYAIPSLGLMLLVAEEGVTVDDFAGFFSRRPAAAWGTVIMLASLIGIPPLVGFFGKLYVFSSALAAGLAPWVVVAVLTSVVSAAYYLRIVRSAFFAVPAQERTPLASSPAASIAILACVAATVALGLAAGPLLGWLGI